MTGRTVDLGFDLGTTYTKVAALGEDGRRLAGAAVPTEWDETGGRSERDPDALVADVDLLLRQVTDDLGPGVTVRSIGFTVMAEAGTAVDAAGVARSPLIAWYDPRGVEQTQAMPAEMAEEFSTVTSLAISQVPSVFKLAWLRSQGLDLRGLQWLSPAEYVICALGGERVCELSVLGRSGLVDIHANRPWIRALDFLGVDESFLPPFVLAGRPAGRVRDDHPVAAVRGAVLTVAGHDHCVAAAATGCGEIGSALDSFGTAEAFVASADHVPAPEVVNALSQYGVSIYPHVVRGSTGILAGSRTGLVLKRVLRMLDADEEPARSILDAAACAIPERSVTDVQVTGYRMADLAISVTLGSDHLTSAQVWRAALDGGTAAAAGILTGMRDHGVPIDRLVVAGGWTRMRSVFAARQSLAARVEIGSVEQPGTAGAALIGRWAAGPGAEPAADPRPPADWFSVLTPTPAHEPR